MAVASCCALLAQVLGSKVAFPGSSPYLATEQAYWSLQESQLTPGCVVLPTSARDVSEVLTHSGNCSVAIKSGGHAPAAGFANVDAGITVDLAHLNSVAFDASQQAAHVGAGARWLDVYRALDPYNVTVAGGRNGAVGVGGLLTGGGISYVSPRVGWGCDSILNMEVVLASGDVVNANSASHPDLFRALKGGSNNFGIVTRFDLRAVATNGGILAGAITSPFSRRQDVLDAFTSFADSPHYDSYASVVTGLTYLAAGGWQSVSSTAVYTTRAATTAATRAFAPFLSVPETNGTLKPTQLGTLANESATPPLEWSFHTGTYRCSAALMRQITASWQATIEATSIPGLLLWTFAFEPLPTVWTGRPADSSLGVTAASGNAFVVLLTGVWNDTASDRLVQQTGDRMLADANQLARQMGRLLPFQYLNYANPQQQPLASYGVRNVAALQAASRRYDPHGVFQHRVSGGFKLPAS